MDETMNAVLLMNYTLADLPYTYCALELVAKDGGRLIAVTSFVDYP